MSDDGTSYAIRIDDETAGLDAALGKLKQAEKATDKASASLGKLGDDMGEAGESSKSAEKQIEALNKRLKELKAPGEIKRLTKEIDEFGKETKEKEGILQHFTKAALGPFLERAKQIAEFEFIRKGIDALIEAPGEIIEKLADLGKEMVLTAAKAERLDQSFTLTLGQEGAEQVLGWIERISSKTEFTDNQLKGWSSELLRAGVKMGDVDKFLAAGLDTAAKSTDKLGGMSRAIEALTRAQITGKVSGRSLLGLSIGNEELKNLPQFKGMNDKQLNKAKEEGSISKEDLLTLIAGPNGVLGDLGLVAGKTFEAQLKNVQEIPEQIYQGLYKTAGFQELGNFLGRIFETFGPETEVASRVAEELANALDVVSSKLQTIDLDGVARNVEVALGELPAVIDTVSATFDALGTILGVFGTAIDALSKGIEYIPQAIGAIIPGFDAIWTGVKAKLSSPEAANPVEAQYEKEQRQKASDARAARAAGKPYRDPDAAFGPQEDPLTRMRKRKDEIRKEQAAQGKLAAQGLEGGAKDGNPKIEAAGASMGDALKEGTAKATETHSPSRALFRLGSFAGEGFVDGIESQRDNIENAMFTAFSGPDVAPAAVAAAQAGSGGSPSITIDIGGITITASSNDPETQALAFADALRQMLPGALISALDGVRAQAGQ